MKAEPALPLAPGLITAAWRYLRTRPTMAIAGGGLLLIILAAIFAPLLAPFDPTEIVLSRRLQAPDGAHWFGTDALGRDILSQVVYGARLSLASGTCAVVLAVAIGAPIGLIAAYYGKWLDMALMRISDMFLAFPPLLLPIAITVALGPGLFNAMIAIGVSWFPWYARIMRAAALSVGEELYVKSAKCAGLSDVAIMRRHILPNSLTPLIVQASMDFGYAILAAASLSFIGLGAQPPAIEWGLMVSQARVFVLDYWWVAVCPGVAIFVTVFTINIFADAIRDVLDPNYRPHI
jgi:peptide/nickel transport system permease protein